MSYNANLYWSLKKVKLFLFQRDFLDLFLAVMHNTHTEGSNVYLQMILCYGLLFSLSPPESTQRNNPLAEGRKEGKRGKDYS